MCEEKSEQGHGRHCTEEWPQGLPWVPKNRPLQSAVEAVVPEVWPQIPVTKEQAAAAQRPQFPWSGVWAAAAGRGTGTGGRHDRRRRDMPETAPARVLQDYGIREALERRLNVQSCPCRHRPARL